MITVKIMGGLGNQMFQYALARKLEAIGKKVQLDTSYYDEIPKGDTQRSKWTDQFHHRFQEVDISSKSGENIKRLAARIRGKEYDIVEKSPNYSPEVLEIHSGYLIGYWQTEKYFFDVAELLRKDFEYDIESFSDMQERLYKKVKNEKNTIAVHIRRGDYLNTENSGIFGNICTREYYRNALTYMSERVQDSKIFVFTDAPEDVKEILPEDSRYEVLSNGLNDEWFELFLMSQCENNIIANSSFSWWGAWMNDHPNKIVIAPPRWTNQNNCQDIYCSHWIRMGT